MSSKKITPRSLIREVLDVNSVSRSVVKNSRTSRHRSTRNSLSAATPGTLIRGVLQTSSTVKKSPAQRKRAFPTPESSRRKSLRRSLGASSSTEPTPRSLIAGYLAATVPETPAFHASVDSTSALESEELLDVGIERDNYQGSSTGTISIDVFAGLISPDSDVSTSPTHSTQSGQGARRSRRYQPIAEEFKEGLMEKLQEEASKWRREEEDEVALATKLDSIVEEPEDSDAFSKRHSHGAATHDVELHSPPDYESQSPPLNGSTSLSSSVMKDVAEQNTLQVHQALPNLSEESDSNASRSDSDEHQQEEETDGERKREMVVMTRSSSRRGGGRQPLDIPPADKDGTQRVLVEEIVGVEDGEMAGDTEDDLWEEKDKGGWDNDGWISDHGEEGADDEESEDVQESNHGQVKGTVDMKEGEGDERIEKDVGDDDQENEELDEGQAEELDEGQDEELDKGQAEELDEGRDEELDEGQDEEINEGQAEELDEGQDKELDEGEDEELDEGQDKELDEGQDEELDEGQDEELDEGQDEELDEGHDEELDEGQDEELHEGQDEEVDDLQDVEKDERINVDEGVVEHMETDTGGTSNIEERRIEANQNEVSFMSHRNSMAPRSSQKSAPDLRSYFSPLITPKLPPIYGLSKTPIVKTPALLRKARNQRQALYEKQGPSTANTKPKPKTRQAAKKKLNTLPSSLTKGIFKHFSRARVAKDAWDPVEECCEEYFVRLSSDLASYARHAHRQTITFEDVELLLKRQGFVTNRQSLYALIEEYLPMEYRKELIPSAVAGGEVSVKLW